MPMQIATLFRKKSTKAINVNYLPCTNPELTTKELLLFNNKEAMWQLMAWWLNEFQECFALCVLLNVQMQSGSHSVPWLPVAGMDIYGSICMIAYANVSIFGNLQI